MPYDFTLTAIMPASAQEVYEAWLDSLAHSQMTGGEASMSDETDAEVSAWDGYISGRNLHLVPGERIVQSWRTTNFSGEHEDSVITLSLEETEDGTLLTLVHSNVPDEQTSYERGGWETHYFEPMKAYFAARRQVPAAKKAKTKTKTKAKPETKAAAPKARPKGAATKPKPAAPRGKPAPSKAKPKAESPAKKAAKGAKAKATGPKAKGAAAKPATSRARPAPAKAKPKSKPKPATSRARIAARKPKAKSAAAPRAKPKGVGKAAPRGRGR
ncbi:MAG: SRPBCC domain-containing protein [Hyphomicrobiales bacterium]